MSISRQEFVSRFAETLEADAANVREDTALSSLEGWDSMGHISTIALFDELFGVVVNVDKLRRCETVRDVMALASDQLTP